MFMKNPPQSIARIVLCALVCILAGGLWPCGSAGAAAQAPPKAGAQNPPRMLPVPDIALPPTDEAGMLPVAPPAPPPPRDTGAEMLRRGIVPVELKPSRPRVLSAPFSALLEQILVRDGEEVKKGQEVARFDAVSLAEEIEDKRRDMADFVERVQNAAGASAREREYAREELARKADSLREAQNRLEQAALLAPVDGRVVEVQAKAGQFLKRGEAVLELAELGDTEIVASVPSTWISRLEPGSLIWVYVDERGRSYEAEIVRFGGRVDGASRRIRVYAKFRQAEPELLPGMGGRADFFPKTGGAR